MQPTYFTAIVLVAGIFLSTEWVLFAEVIFCLFGTAAAINLPALGGSAVMPAVLFVPFLLLRAAGRGGMGAVLVRVPRAAVPLVFLTLWGLFSSIAVPRYLAGKTLILGVDRFHGQGLIAQALRPVSGNITQAAYALSGLLTFLAARALLNSPSRAARFRDAVLWLGALNSVAAVINLLNVYAGLPPILDVFRTANYAMFSAYENHTGLVRISGTFSETSAFSTFTFPLFAFSAALWLERERSLFSGIVAFCSLTFLLLSTSGTAYVGLVLYSGSLAVTLLWRGYNRGSVPRLLALCLIGLLVVLLLGTVFAFELPFAQKLITFFDQTVGQKMQSTSGIERASWNRHAWQNFIDTYGIGAGLGSARASSFLMVLLSNVGLPGLILFGAFVAAVLRGPRHPEAARGPLQFAATQGVLATLAPAVVSGAAYELGGLFYLLAAAASSSVPLPVYGVSPRTPRASAPSQAYRAA